MTKAWLKRQSALLTARPLVVDGLLAAGLLVWSLFSLSSYGEYHGVVYRQADWTGVILIGVATVPLAWRRRYPLPTSVTVSLAALALGLLEYSAPLVSVAVLLAIYSCGAYATFRRGLVALVVAMASTTIDLLWFYERYPELGAASSIGIFAVLIATIGLWALGRGVRNRRRYLRALEDRAHRLERTRAAEVRAAVAEERGRIARELHDVVAHHVAVMTVQAAAARRTLAGSPERSLEAMEAVESTGRAALVEMRRLVGVLRGPDETEATMPADRNPQPGLGDLPSLVEQLREAGLTTEFAIHGDQRELASGVDVTVFRVVQEALTNTLKHAAATCVRVDIYFLSSELALAIVDDGHGAAADPVNDGDNDEQPGHGLIGMRERVALYGGSLQAGPRRGGGFEVNARLPLEPSPTPKVFQ